MKFSQFKDTNKLQNEVYESLIYLNKIIKTASLNEKFYLIPKLNILIRKNTSVKLFLDVTKEYRKNKFFFTKYFSLIYILLTSILIKLRLAQLFFKTITIECPDFYPIILGGNNRFRLIEASNNHALVMAKTPKDIFFVKNAIRAKKEIPISKDIDIPNLIPINERVYYEEQIDSIAINRLSLNENQKGFLENSMNFFFNYQSIQSRTISIKSYLRYKLHVLNYYREINNDDVINDLVDEFKETIQKIYKKQSLRKLNVCLSHGDLNRGNVFINNEKLHIIDWEFFMYRFSKYDYYIYTKNLRHIDFDAYLKSLRGILSEDLDGIIFLLEELNFRILNYKDDVPHSKIFINQILEIIKQNING